MLWFSDRQLCAVLWLHRHLNGKKENRWWVRSQGRNSGEDEGSYSLCVSYLQASYAQQAPHPPLSGSPASERGTVWPGHCPATPTKHPDRTPPCRSHTDCCLCPPGTSAENERRNVTHTVDWLPTFTQLYTHPYILPLTSCTSVVVFKIRILFCEPHQSLPPTGTILVMGLVGMPRTNVWEDWESQKLPADFKLRGCYSERLPREQKTYKCHYFSGFQVRNISLTSSTRWDIF